MTKSERPTTEVDDSLVTCGILPPVAENRRVSRVNEWPFGKPVRILSYWRRTSRILASFDTGARPPVESQEVPWRAGDVAN